MPLPGTKPPPVFVTLMKSAPARTCCSRTARQLQGVVDLPANEVHVAAGGRDDAAAERQPRPLRDPEADRLAEVAIDHAMAGAAVAKVVDAREGARGWHGRWRGW